MSDVSDKDAFQREVQEEYRRELMAKFWAQYRVAIIAGATALIVGVAGYEGWSYWHARQIEQSSRALEAVSQQITSEQGTEKQAADALAKIAAGGSGGYPLLAKFQEAALRAEMGDLKAALTLYDELAASGPGGALFRDYAQIRAALLTVETAPFDDIKKRLEPIAEPDNPWRVAALELLAYASWRAGKKDDALKLYAEVKVAPGAPQGSVRRATEMTALIGAGMKLADVKPPAAPSPAEEPLLLPPTPSTGTESLLPPAAPEQPSSLLGQPAQPQSPTP